MDRVIVSRHIGAIQFITQVILEEMNPYLVVKEFLGDVNGDSVPTQLTIGYYKQADIDELETNSTYLTEWVTVEEVPILTQANKEEVQDKVVYGNLPLHLAQYTKYICAVEFEDTPPRGLEYTLEDMIFAKAKISRYTINKCQ